MMGITMTLTATQKELVQTSFALAAMEAEKTAETFYSRLFEIAPHTKTLFRKTDMSSQGMKLMQTMATLVVGLDRMEDIIEPIRHLGVRHVGYGVKPADYDAVGQALIWTFETTMGAEFTEEIRAAWLEVYSIVAKTAIGATSDAAP
jgi:hemoglobin-like flavoprotein